MGFSLSPKYVKSWIFDAGADVSTRLIIRVEHDAEKPYENKKLRPLLTGRGPYQRE